MLRKGFVHSWLSLFLLLGCGDDDPGFEDASTDMNESDAQEPVSTLAIERLFASDVLEGCTYASPIQVTSRGKELVLSVSQKGIVLAVDPMTGETEFTYQLPIDPEDEYLDVLATPAIVDEGTKLIFGYQEIIGDWNRQDAELVVFDLETREVSTDFGSLTLGATVPTANGMGDVVFDAHYQLMRSEIQVVPTADTDLGLAYVSLGNGPSVQPFHGWVFEIDLDEWRSGSEAIANVLVTTRENECGANGNRDGMVCGGGVWNAAGVTIEPTDDGGYELLVPTGNGRVDLDREAYSHAVMRTGRGLSFDDGCDDVACAGFDERDPDPACLATCSNVFIAHETEESPLDRPHDGRCDGMTFQECYGVIDGDLGANAPVVVRIPGGPEVVVQGGKDGAVYLADRSHLGQLYQRLQIIDACGSEDDPCRATWKGMLVTKPAVAVVDGDPVVVFPGFVDDRSTPAGVVALRLFMDDDRPRMEVLWRAPDFSTGEALTTFRHHPGRPVLVEWAGETYVLVVETRRTRRADDDDIGRPPGTLWAIRVRDGHVAVRQPITDAGQRFALPLVIEDRVYISTCDPTGLATGQLEGFRLLSE